MEQTSFAEDIRKLPIGGVWFVAVVFALLVVGATDPAQAFRDAIENQGLSDQQISDAAFIAGYSLPFTVATGIVVAVALAGEIPASPATAAGIALIYWVAGLLATEYGLGLAPAAVYETVQGHPLVAIPLNVLNSYFTSYGAPLMAASLALGAAGGIQVDRWMNPRTADPPAAA